MEEKKKDAIALFRYGIIAPLITQGEVSEKTRRDFLVEASLKRYEYIDGSFKTFSYDTLYNYYKKYRRFGFDGLRPNNRSDDGKSRKIDKEVKDMITYLHREYPRLPCTIIYEKLIAGRLINKNDLSLSTVTRFVNKLGKDQGLPDKEYKRYELEHINEVWYGDSSRGPYIEINGKKHKIYIIALIDDASRMVVGCEAFLNDNYINLMSVIKEAVIKYGKPKTLKFDNGSNYRSNQMTLLAARLGIILSYAPPYTPTGKAKIERWFRTLKDQYLSSIRMNEYKDRFEKFNDDLKTYVRRYNQTKHLSLDTSPQDRFFSEGELIKYLDRETIDKSFLVEIERRVTKDGLVSIDGKEYEVGYKYALQKVILRYDHDLSHIYVLDKGSGELEEVKLLNKHHNADHIRHNRSFRFSEVG